MTKSNVQYFAKNYKAKTNLPIIVFLPKAHEALEKLFSSKYLIETENFSQAPSCLNYETLVYKHI
jgi:hypothetical protein